MQLNFAEICASVPFIALLDHLNLPYEEQDDKITVKDDNLTYVISKEKNLFLNPHNKEEKGGIIDFTVLKTGKPLKEAAKFLKETFMTEAKPEEQKQIPVLTLEYHEHLQGLGISEETANRYEVGYVKKGTMAGKIAFKVEDKGYVGYTLKDGKWFFPKGFTRATLWNADRATTDYAIITADLFDALHLLNIGCSYTCSLMGVSMTEAQQALISLKFKRIFLVHSSPANIVNRLSDYHFVKTHRGDVKTLDYAGVKALF